MNNKIIITSPSLNPQINVSGIASVTQFIINANTQNEYLHFELGKSDTGTRDIPWLMRILKTYFKWGFLLLTQRNILIHFNIALDKRALIRDSPLIFIARIFQKRMIIHIHGGEVLTHPKNPLWIKHILKFNFSGQNPKVVLSSQEKETLKQIVNRDNIFVLPNCVELKEAVKFNRKYNDDEGLTLLFMGRIVLTKGIEYIYQALKSLKEDRISFKFIMAGKGPDEILYVERFKDLLGENFEFKGVVSGNTKTELLKFCNIFLLPSFFEGLPVALLEGMSFGLVPVTTDVGSIRYLIKNETNGIFVNKFSSDDIVSAIKRLEEDKEYLKKLSLNAREYIFNNYDGISYMSKLNEIYNYE